VDASALSNLDLVFCVDLTGGSYHSAQTGDGAMQIVEMLSLRCFADLDFDRKPFEKLEAGAEPDAATLAKALGATEDAIHAAQMRLRQRGLVRAQK
jgi:hypothetical protein